MISLYSVDNRLCLCQVWLTCEDIVPTVPVKPGVCLWTTLRANKNIKTNFIPIHIVTRIFDATTIMPSSPSQKIYHHLVKCQHHNCHCYVCYHDQHLPLNFIAFSVSKSPLPSTCAPISSSFLYTWTTLSQYNDDHNEDDLAVRADCEICCCAGSGWVALCLVFSSVILEAAL